MKRQGMDDQLVLLEEPSRDWRLDERTRRLGRRGIAEARLALRRAAAREAKAAARDTAA